MVEKILPYDRNIVPQETGYWCGPASTQVVLNSLGIHVNEPDMARELRTHTGGTDWIGQFPAVLNKYTNAGYFHVEMPHDPPSTEQKERLWRDIVASINGGRGVIANIVAPPSNYPRGVNGSVSPRYGGGTVYHYFSVMGYDDAGARSVWVADSGFQPQGYWMSFDQLASLIPPKGYVAAPGPAAPPPPARSGMDAKVLARAMGDAVSAERYAKLAPAFISAMVQAGCTTIERAAMWCAQLGHESVGLRYMEEIADGSAYEGRADLGNTQPGDGRRFKGRGPIQVTGRHNYTKLSEWAHSKGYVPTPTYFVDNPSALADDRYGFLGAVWYWTVARPQINELCDRRDIVGVTRAINGGTNGLPDRTLRWNRCLEIGAALLPTTGGDAPMSAAEVQEIKDFIVAYCGPGLSDTKDVRAQLTGSPDLVLRADGTVDVEASFPGWSQLGGRTVVDAIARILQNQVAIAERLDRLLKEDVSNSSCE